MEAKFEPRTRKYGNSQAQDLKKSAMGCATILLEFIRASKRLIQPRPLRNLSELFEKDQVMMTVNLHHQNQLKRGFLLSLLHNLKCGCCKLTTKLFFTADSCPFSLPKLPWSGSISLTS